MGGRRATRRRRAARRPPASAARPVVEALDVVADGGREACEALGLELERLGRRHGLTVRLVMRPAAGRPPSG